MEPNNDLELNFIDDISEPDAPLTKKKLGRPKGPEKPPKENGRKIRSEAQKEAWAKALAKTAENRRLVKQEKDEKMADIYMTKKAREKKIEVIEKSESEDSESSAEIVYKYKKATAKATTKAKAKAKAKTKAKSKPKKVVYISDSESEISDSSSDEDIIIKRKPKKNNVKVYREPEQVVEEYEEYDNSSYFV